MGHPLQMAEFSLQVVNGWAILPASLKSPSNAPRFHIEFPVDMREDRGAQYLARSEHFDGYELPTRNLLEKALRPGDVFVDVGAHWGFFTLQAATHPAGNIRAIAFEPAPANARILFRNIIVNHLTDTVQLVCAACGDENDIAPLVSNPSSMGHSIRGVGLKPPHTQGPSCFVPIVKLDDALASLPNAATGRVILKIDAEGFEPQVLAGAQSLVRSQRIALIIWERGSAFADGPERYAMVKMVDDLSEKGYRHFRHPGRENDGQLVPFDTAQRGETNVFSFAPGTEL